jgi:RNA polymerase sigma factor (sigma-70 family)
VPEDPVTDTISSLPTLPPEELSALTIRARTDRRAGDQLVRVMLRYVESFAKQFSPVMDDEDMVSVGILGLWRAVQNYDPEMGTFPTYAAWWIKSYMREERRKRPTVCLTRNDIAKGEKAVGLMSLDSPFGESGETYEDALPDEDTVDPVSQIQSKEERVRVQQALAKMSPRKREVILGRMAGKTLQEIGDKIGISREGVRQIEATAMANLRDILQQDL